MQRHQRHDFRGHEVAVDALVRGDAPAHPIQEQRLGAGTQAPPGRLLQERLADEAQAHGSHAPARGLARARIDDAYLGGERTGGKRGRGSKNKVPFIAAVQTTPEGHPLYACFAKQPFTSQAVAMWAAKSLATSALVVSDGLWCFRGVTIIGAEHQPIVTRGGKGSSKLPQFKAVNTLLGNLKTSLKGTYHAFDFTKYAHRYLAEAQYRFNRRFNLASILARLLRAASLTQPRSAPLIRLAEEWR